MEYRKYGSTWYIRMDRGDEIVGGILEVCRREGIGSAVYQGIGGCGEAELQTFIPEAGAFETERVTGVLEVLSVNGDVITGDDGALCHHTHAAIAWKEGGAHRMAGGHVKSLTVLYTAEIELRPVIGGTIGRQYSPETGTGFWRFDD